jgi:hypothetical protein
MDCSRAQLMYCSDFIRRELAESLGIEGRRRVLYLTLWTIGTKPPAPAYGWGILMFDHHRRRFVSKPFTQAKAEIVQGRRDLFNIQQRA